jgi:hypothetical protein
LRISILFSFSFFLFFTSATLNMEDIALADLPDLEKARGN